MQEGKEVKMQKWIKQAEAARAQFLDGDTDLIHLSMRSKAWNAAFKWICENPPPVARPTVEELTRLRAWICPECGWEPAHRYALPHNGWFCTRCKPQHSVALEEKKETTNVPTNAG